MDVRIGSLTIGLKQPLLIIAGPCVIEGWDITYNTAVALKELSFRHGFSLVFKSSFDKANRTAVDSFRGPGMEEGLALLSDIKKKLSVELLSDIHEVAQCEQAGQVLDVLQIPAFLCRQTDLLVAAAKTGKAVNIKKGQFVAPSDMSNAVKKVVDSGNDNVILTERGTTFGYNNLVVDMRSLPIMRATGYPVVFDATHSVQLPGGGGTVSSGQRQFVPHLARAAVAAGCDGVFMEVHPNPDQAKSDGPNQICLSQVEDLIVQLLKIHAVASSLPELVLTGEGQSQSHLLRT
ncbi:MAG: 3-deoxy-8-phosphooctulonate synthase [Candidatus Obscuribacterales bacterium]|nr:3-deoxy-8-phosphooctulonate synthase [Candidatus Obscuribacterales bacterium]